MHNAHRICRFSGAKKKGTAVSTVDIKHWLYSASALREQTVQASRSFDREVHLTNNEALI
jgi:hypothetical protein